MAQVPSFGSAIVVGGVRRMITPLVEEKTYVDANTAKLQRLREEEEREEQRRAEIDYERHMREMHPRKRTRSDEEEMPLPNDEDDEELEAIDISKRVRSFDRETDSNWYAEASPEGTRAPAVPVMYSKQKELESLREFSPAEEAHRPCFACEYLTVAAHAAIYADDWRKVVDFFKATLPLNRNMRDWGQELYAFFDRTVGDSLRSRGELQEGEAVWSPYGILFHFLEHNRDPIVQIMRDYWAYTEIHSVIINNEMFQMDPTSGRVSTSDAAIKKLKTVAEMREKLMRTNPYRLPFASNEVNAASSSKEVTAQFIHPYSQMRQRTNLAEAHSRWKT